MKISSTDNATSGRGSKSSKDEDDDKETRARRRSVSRSRRKKRLDKTKILDDTGLSCGSDVDKKPPRSNSIRNLFNRGKQENHDG